MKGIEMVEQIYKFKLDGEPVFCDFCGNGHINSTYMVLDSTGRLYVLQKINKNVFKDPDSLMKNIAAVTSHLRKLSESAREVLTLLPTLDGKSWLVDEQGEYWRLYNFISDTMCFDLADNENDFRESALAFGLFQRRLADFPAHTLIETIPHFHDTPWRYEALKDAIKADLCGRAKNVGAEIEFALALEEYASTLVNLQNSGELPLRVTHNDAKLNNVLFDRDTHKAICVIDLDTVMPGLSVNDFGDSIRFGASTAVEDEQDLSKVNFSKPMFEAYVSGYLQSCGESLADSEIEYLRDGAKMMTLECGIRFLADYLQGDIYFHTRHQSHNLDRCRTQFRLVEDMDKNWDEMQSIIYKYAKR